jgi:hypothetical protein
LLQRSKQSIYFISSRTKPCAPVVSSTLPIGGFSPELQSSGLFSFRYRLPDAPGPTLVLGAERAVALAALAGAGVASAQSSVTLFGVVDASISGYSSNSRDRNGATLLNPSYLNQGSVKVSQRKVNTLNLGASCMTSVP